MRWSYPLRKNAGILWFEYEMTITCSCVRGLVLSWQHYFGMFWKLLKWGLAGKSRLLKMGLWECLVPGPFRPLSLLPVCYEVSTYFCCHDVLPNLIRPSDYSLSPLKLWAKIDPSSLSCLSDVLITSTPKYIRRFEWRLIFIQNLLWDQQYDYLHFIV
jgi:hypothetical protein